MKKYRITKQWDENDYNEIIFDVDQHGYIVDQKYIGKSSTSNFIGKLYKTVESGFYSVWKYPDVIEEVVSEDKYQICFGDEKIPLESIIEEKDYTYESDTYPFAIGQEIEFFITHINKRLKLKAQIKEVSLEGDNK